MKIITWNCQGAFRKKAAIILMQHPDIVVVQECEHPDKLIFAKGIQKPNDIHWCGDNQHKGLGLFSYSEFKFSLHSLYNPDFKYVIPISVTGGVMDFILFAIWTNNPSDKNGCYVEQVWKAIHHYESILSNSPVIITGDFNSNTIWDRKSRDGNHTDVVMKLAKSNIHSIYHKQSGEDHGKENIATFYLYRNVEKPYHLDYCFASVHFHEKTYAFEIGSFDYWIAFSDHLPLIIEFY